ncbi:DUF6308 family protein [Arthrobacter sp. ZBG10]|uniref:DUF6308 family protein n=1 Tax=Arthrobacter sp. ZBG10 TaxID=1676590 RepID=UPI0012F7518D|nr:DUF6308 family protein [Arthrobacter sp. ZBG10]
MKLSRNRYGLHFDRLPTVAGNRITSEDIVAVSCLSVHVPAAAVKILSGQADEISTLLSRIPDLNLEEIPIDQHEGLFGTGSAALELWLLLRNHVGIGPTTASKLMARKRPGLIPIYDSVVARVTGFDSSAGTWRAWHNALSSDEALKIGWGGCAILPGWSESPYCASWMLCCGWTAKALCSRNAST